MFKKFIKVFLIIILFLPLTSFLNQTLPVKLEEIIQSAEKGDTDIFVSLMKNKTNLNIKDKNGNTLFHLAAKYGHKDLIKLLATYDIPEGKIDSLWQFFFGTKRPDINSQNNNGDTPLHYATENGDFQIIALLLWNKADPSIRNKKNYTVLLRAAEKGDVENTLYFMGFSDEYYKETINGNNILHIALSHNKQELAKELISTNNIINSQDPDFAQHNTLTKAQNNYGETPFLYCTKTNNIEILKLLSEDNTYVDSVINILDSNKYSPLSYACYQKSDEIFNFLLQYKPQLNISTISNAIPMHIVLKNSNFKRAEQLIALGASINIQDTEIGNTPLHNAIYEDDETKITWLLKHQANIAIRNKNKRDMMGAAISAGHSHLLPLLITYGADVNKTDENNQTQLMIELSKGHNKMAIKLIELKADINHIDKNGENCLHITTRFNNIEGAQLILNQNKKLIHQKNNSGNYPLHLAADNKKSSQFVELYVKNDASVNEPNIYGETALHRAAAAGNSNSIHFLKNNFASLNSVTKNNNSPAHYALLYNNFDCLLPLLNKNNVNIINNEGKTIFNLAIEKKLSKKLLQKIIDHGVNLDLQPDSQNGNSYLHYAITLENTDALPLLMIPSLINKKNNYDITPLSYAVQKNNNLITSALLQKGAHINIADKNGWTEVHHCAALGNEIIFTLLYNYGGFLSKRTNNGDTPLHIAAAYNKVNIINFIKTKEDNREKENDNGETALTLAVLNGHLEATKALITEEHFINDKVEHILSIIKPSFFPSQAQLYLQQKLMERNNAFNSIIEMQNILTTLQKNSHITDNLLQQRAIKENSHLACKYQSTHFTLYTLDQLKKWKLDQLINHKAFLDKEIQQEKTKFELMTQKLKQIDKNNYEKELKKQQEAEALKKQQEYEMALEKAKQNIVTQTTNPTPSTDLKPPVILQEEQQPDEKINKNENNKKNKYNICLERKDDAQRRCPCEQCDKKYCDKCIQDLFDKGRDTCLYCYQPWKK